MYLNYDKAVAKAKVNAEIAVKTLTWDETARKYLDAIGRDQLELPNVEANEWIEPVTRRYLVRVKTPKFFVVGGLQYILEPGRDYFEPADVKRVLFDGGNLDISCLPQNMMINEGADGGAPINDIAGIWSDARAVRENPGLHRGSRVMPDVSQQHQCQPPNS